MKPRGPALLAGLALLVPALGGLNEFHALVSPRTGRRFLVGLSTRGGTALRVRLDAMAPPVDSPMVHPEEGDADWSPTTSETYGRGILSPIGALYVSDTGVLTVVSTTGQALTWTDPLTSTSELAFSSRVSKVYGMGAGPSTAQQLARAGNVTPIVDNQYGRGSEAIVPHYYTTDGYAALGVVDDQDQAEGSTMSATFMVTASSIFWRNTRSGPFEIYFMPATTLELGTMAYYSLIGRPRVPPLWTFGFMASRWGWEDAEYINRTLWQFRSGGFPADAFILDFEWYASETDYDYGPQGSSQYFDFGYADKMFREPSKQFAAYREELHFRMGGIRKPRLCNTKLLAMARTKRWLLQLGAPGGDPTKPGFSDYYAVGRNLNLADPLVRHWYAEQHLHYLDDGVEFWWNDEGETAYFQYEWWNVAQEEAHRARRQGQRRWSLNRAFSPGMARFGVGLWTGDSGASWEVLALQPGYVLNWALAGGPYVGSDVGGFASNPTADLLVRWYQLSVFTPIMRVHSTQVATPHFPWLWGAQAAKDMKGALELRYRLIPYHYSFAHMMFEGRRLWMRPMEVAFPDAAAVAGVTSQWMDGEILVAPVVDSNSMRKVILPNGTWHMFDADGNVAPPALSGPTLLGGRAFKSEIPAFVLAGTIVPLAPVVQHTDALPGGPLEVRVYGGADAKFELVEDDGHTVEYESGVGLRRTTFLWNDASQTLSWSCEGRPPPSAFTRLFLQFYAKHGAKFVSEVVDLTSLGSVSLGGRRLRG